MKKRRCAHYTWKTWATAPRSEPSQRRCKRRFLGPGAYCWQHRKDLIDKVLR